mmetsp:Transcript_11049/g.18075  ORF Transcript_11049/g.18075 Transcript_11049/m.18075 type:complete len:329 (-) Transcript_11049:472-1458(-)
MERTDLEAVVIDAVVVLKIIKHCKESLPTLVTGQLLGLDVERTLEVTNCFPFPSPSAEEDDETADAQGAEYQLEMMRCYRELNMDSNTVGWYQSTYLGSFPIDNMIETQANYQETIKKAVCIVYDPVRTHSGTLYLKAYRLSDVFVDIYKAQRFTQETVAKSDLSFNSIFEEVPLRFHNAHLVKALFLDLESSPDASLQSADFDRLELTYTPFVERSLEFVNECMDDLVAEQGKFQYYQRQLARQAQQQRDFLAKRKDTNEALRRAGQEPLADDDLANNLLFKPIPEPSRLETLLITYQINTYCNQMNAFAGQGISKLFLAEAVRRDA